MEKQKYLITGIAGFIGSLIAKKILESLKYKNGEIFIYGIVRDIDKAKRMFSAYNCEHIKFIEADICDKNTILALESLSVDYIIHCAATTQSQTMVKCPVETLDGLVIGTKNVLDLALCLQAKSVVMLSSMEAYGVVEDDGRLLGEEELGCISMDEVRSCYPLGKRMAEYYCSLYKKEYDLPVKVARLSQVFGKGVRPEDNRVYMQFARAVKENRDIVLHTDGTSIGNYCDSTDAVEAIFTILFKGEDGEIYNVVNEENTMCIRELADVVANQVAGGRIQVKYEIADSVKNVYAPKTGLRLSAKKLRALGWKPTKSVKEMFLDVMKEI